MPKIEKPGTYNATVKEAFVEQTQNGSWRVALGFETDDGDGIFGYLYLTDKAVDRSIETLEKVFAFDCNFETLAAQLEGKRCSITCAEENYQDRLVMRVQWINAERKKAGANPLRELTLLACKRRGKPVPAPSKPESEEEPF